MTETGGVISTSLALDTSNYIKEIARVSGINVSYSARTRREFESISAKMANMSSQVSKFSKKYSGAMSASSAETTKFSARISDLSNKLKFAAANAQWTGGLNVHKLSEVNSALSGFNKNMGIANTNIGKVTQTSNTFGRKFTMVSGLIDTTGMSFQKAGSTASVFGNNIATAGQKLGGINTWLRRVSSALGVITTFMAIRMVGAVVSFAAEFEAGLTKIVSLVGMTRKQVEEWGAALGGMASSTATDINKLNDALYYITSGGIRGATESLDTLRQVAMASAAGLGDISRIADTVVASMNAWKKAGLSAEQATGVLLATVREGKLRAEDLSNTFSKVIPIAASLGVSMGQVGGALAVLSRSGMNAATATTGLRRLLLALAKPSKQAEQALNSVGLSGEFLRNVMAGPNGLQEALEYLAIASEGSFEKIASGIPNIRALGPALTFINAKMNETREIFGKVDADQTSTVFDAYEKGSEDLKRAIDEMTGAWSAFKTVVINTGAVKKAIDLVAGGIRNITELLNIKAQGKIDTEIIGWANIFSDAMKRLDTDAEKLDKFAAAMKAAERDGLDLSAFLHQLILELDASGDASDDLIASMVAMVAGIKKEKEEIEGANSALESKGDIEKRLALDIEKARIAEEKRLKSLPKAIKAAVAASKATQDYSFGLVDISDKTRAAAKEQEKLEAEYTKSVLSLDELTAGLIKQFDAYARLHPEARELTEDFKEQALALWDSNESVEWITERLKELGVEFKFLGGSLEDNKRKMTEYEKAVRSAADSISDAFNDQSKNAITAALTGDFDELISSFSNLGETLATAFAEAFNLNTGKKLSDLIKSWVAEGKRDSEGNLLEGETDGWLAEYSDTIGKAALGVQALAAGYGIYQGAQQGEVSVGEGALSGATTGASIGASFSPLGAAIGAVIGAIAGAAIAYFGKEDPSRIGLRYSDGGAEQTRRSHFSQDKMDKLLQDVDQVVSTIQSAFMDVAEMFGDPELFKDMNLALKDLAFDLDARGHDIGVIIENMLSDDIPSIISSRARTALYGAFEKIGFGDLFNSAFDQASKLAGDAGVEFLTRVAAGANALHNAMQDLDFESLIEDLSMTQMDTFEKFMTNSLSDISLIQQRMANEFDAAAMADDAGRIAQIIQDARSSELQMLAQIKQAQDSINATWDNINRQIDLVDTSSFYQFEYFTTSLSDALESLRGAEGPAAIQRYSEDMQNEFQNLMGLVSEGDWNKKFSSWTEFADPTGNLLGPWKDLGASLGIDFNDFTGTVKEFFQMFSGALREETDNAFSGANDRVEEWANALEQAALDTAEALNTLGESINEVNFYGPNSGVLDEINAATVAYQVDMIDYAKTNTRLMEDYIATPPTVEINIDGTLDPLISLIDARIQTARDVGGP